MGPHARRLRKIWEGIRRRCEEETDPSYLYYGARGARLCAAWKDFRAFYRWAIESRYEPGLCVTRHGRAPVYSPRNCRWTTRAALWGNHSDSSMPPRWTVEAFGERKGPTEWSRDGRCQVSLTGLTRRLRSGWPPEEAISCPPRNAGRTGESIRAVEAFGVTKSMTEWSRDRRCKVALTTIAERLDRGVSPEKAISTPPFGLRVVASGRSPRKPKKRLRSPSRPNPRGKATDMRR